MLHRGKKKGKGNNKVENLYGAKACHNVEHSLIQKWGVIHSL